MTQAICDFDAPARIDSGELALDLPLHLALCRAARDWTNAVPFAVRLDGAVRPLVTSDGDRMTGTDPACMALVAAREPPGSQPVPHPAARVSFVFSVPAPAEQRVVDTTLYDALNLTASLVLPGNREGRALRPDGSPLWSWKGSLVTGPGRYAVMLRALVVLMRHLSPVRAAA